MLFWLPLGKSSFSRSSMTERPADNRKTVVRYRAGEPSASINQENHHDHRHQTGAAGRRISTPTDPERSSPRRLGNGLLIRAVRGSTPPGSSNRHDQTHTTSSIGRAPSS